MLLTRRWSLLASLQYHLSPSTKFNFQQYIKRSLEDDFKVVVGIRSVRPFQVVF